MLGIFNLRPRDKTLVAIFLIILLIYGSTCVLRVPKTSDAITTNLGFSQVVGGASYSLALDAKGELYSWGVSYVGQLGLGQYVDSYLPQKVSDLVPSLAGVYFKSIATAGDSSFAITINGELYVWGDNYYNKLGFMPNPYAFPYGVFYPENLSARMGGLKFKSVTGGLNHIVACTENGELYSAGLNNFGQLGIGSTTASINLVKLSDYVNIKGIVFSEVVGNRYTSFALTENGELYAWGQNSSGQFGLGDSDHPGVHNRNYSPQNISSQLGGKLFKKIASNGSSVLAIDKSDDLFSWGFNNFGILGLGDDTNQIPRNYTPNNISALLGGVKFKGISMGQDHSLILSMNGDAYASGSNEDGQLGKGVDNNSISQIVLFDKLSIAGKAKIAAVNSGAKHSLLVTTSGEVYSFGYNLNSALGLGDRDSPGLRNNSPNSIGSLTPATSTFGYSENGGFTPIGSAKLPIDTKQLCLSFDEPMNTDMGLLSKASISLVEKGQGINLLENFSSSQGSQIQPAVATIAWSANGRDLNINLAKGSLKPNTTYVFQVSGLQKASAFNVAYAQSLEFMTSADSKGVLIPPAPGQQGSIGTAKPSEDEAKMPSSSKVFKLDNAKNPKTGDDNIILILGLMALILCAIFAFVIRRSLAKRQRPC